MKKAAVLDMPADVTVERPVLRYHGGKWVLAEWVISNFPVHRLYVEPFGGAASVLMQKRRSYVEVYNELDGEIVNVFRVLRDPVQALRLKELLTLTPFAHDEFVASYETHPDPVEQARRTVTRAMMGWGSAAASGFGTGFRSNSGDDATSPANDWKRYPGCIDAFVQRLRGVIIDNRDWEELLLRHDSPKTLFYVDPPYPMSTRKLLNPDCPKGYRFEMTDDDHRRLAAALHALDSMVIISGYACALYDEELYPEWTRRERTGSYASQGSSSTARSRERTEVLWMNPRAVANSRQAQLFACD